MLSVKAVIQNGPSLFVCCNNRYDELGCNSPSVVTTVTTNLVVTAVTTNINRNKDVASFQRPKIVVHFGQCQTKNSELRDEGW